MILEAEFGVEVQKIVFELLRLVFSFSKGSSKEENLTIEKEFGHFSILVDKSSRVSK